MKDDFVFFSRRGTATKTFFNQRNVTRSEVNVTVDLFSINFPSNAEDCFFSYDQLNNDKMTCIALKTRMLLQATALLRWKLKAPPNPNFCSMENQTSTYFFFNGDSISPPQWITKKCTLRPFFIYWSQSAQ